MFLVRHQYWLTNTLKWNIFVLENMRTKLGWSLLIPVPVSVQAWFEGGHAWGDANSAGLVFRREGETYKQTQLSP